MVPGVAPWEIPEYTAVEFREKRSRHCVCIFVLNEGGRIIAQLRRMGDYTQDVDIIIADGGSTDGSVEEELLASLGARALLIKRGEGRLSAQMRMAFGYALLQGYMGIVTMDGNDKDDPSAIPQFAQALDRGFDHVQGSRFVSGGRAINTPWLRLLGIKLVHAPLVSLAAGFRYTDTTNGFRAYSRQFLLDPRVAPFRAVFSTYELHYYLAIRAPRLGYRVKEIPVTRKYPDKGSTPTKISPIKGNLLVMKVLLEACGHRFDPPGARRSQEGRSAGA